MSDQPTDGGRISKDRPAVQYVPEVNAGWEYRMVNVLCGGRWHHTLCEVLWVQGKIVVARPMKMPFSSSATTWRDCWDALVDAAERARKKPILEVEAGVVDWERM